MAVRTLSGALLGLFDRSGVEGGGGEPKRETKPASSNHGDCS